MGRIVGSSNGLALSGDGEDERRCEPFHERVMGSSVGHSGERAHVETRLEMHRL